MKMALMSFVTFASSNSTKPFGSLLASRSGDWHMALWLPRGEIKALEI
jgi:hypothetical protein